MKNIDLKKYTPVIVAVILFIVLSFLYFSPMLEGKKLKQGDIAHFKGVSKEIIDWRDNTGEEALWTNVLFCGMPAWQISVQYPANLMKYVDKIFTLGIPRPASFLFLFFIGFFILLLTLGLDPWLATVGSIVYAFSSYFLIVVGAGHNSQAHAIGYMAPVFAGVIMTYNGKWWSGGVLTALFLALMLKANHIQITYYLFILILIYLIFIFFKSLKDGKIPYFIKASIILMAATMLAAGTSTTNLWATYNYGKYTTRGKSELTLNEKDKTTGLDRSYVTQWSYGVSESFTLMIPSFKGGPSQAIGNDPSLLKSLDPQVRQVVAQLDGYFGDQPFTSGPVYVGAIVCFLFILGLFILKGYLRWVLLIGTLMSIMLAWGKNFMGLTNLFLDYFPMYNKFRAVTMLLVVAELTIPLLAILALHKIFKQPNIIREKRNAFFIALASTAGLSLIFWLMPESFNTFFKSDELVTLPEQLKKAGFPDAQIGIVLDGLKDVRISIFRSDAIRSVLFILLAAACIYAFSRNIIKQKLFVIGFAVLFLADLWPVDKRYLNKDDFTTKAALDVPYVPDRADLQILQDKDPDYRVFNTTIRLDQDSRTSYFHKSLGGYHGAKLKRYQEMIDYHIGRGNMAVINMLNARYFIIKGEDGQNEARQNPGALGNAWFVKKYQIVANADSELMALKGFNPKNTAIIDARFKSMVQGFEPNFDSTAQIKLTDYKPYALTYQSNAKTEQLTVFSEMYYPDGWNVYVDGTKSEYFRCNYILRAMRLPAGKHTIEFKFEPNEYSVGEAVSLASCIILLLIVADTVYIKTRKSAEERP